MNKWIQVASHCSEFGLPDLVHGRTLIILPKRQCQYQNNIVGAVDLSGDSVVKALEVFRASADEKVFLLNPEKLLAVPEMAGALDTISWAYAHTLPRTRTRNLNILVKLFQTIPQLSFSTLHCGPIDPERMYWLSVLMGSHGGMKLHEFRARYGIQTEVARHVLKTEYPKGSVARYLKSSILYSPSVEVTDLTEPPEEQS